MSAECCIRKVYFLVNYQFSGNTFLPFSIMQIGDSNKRNLVRRIAPADLYSLTVRLCFHSSDKIERILKRPQSLFTTFIYADELGYKALEFIVHY